MDEPIPEDHEHIYPEINDGGCWCGMTQVKLWDNLRTVEKVEEALNKFSDITEEED